MCKKIDLKKEFEKAYGGENYAILEKHINEKGWCHTDWIHDPVCTAGFEFKEFPAEVGYSNNLYMRPISLRWIDEVKETLYEKFTRFFKKLWD